MKIKTYAFEDFAFRRVFTSGNWDSNKARTIMSYFIEGKNKCDLYYVASWLEGKSTDGVLLKRCPDSWILLGVSGKWITVKQWRETFGKN